MPNAKIKSLVTLSQVQPRYLQPAGWFNKINLYDPFPEIPMHQLTRRTFLAASAAAPLILPSTARAFAANDKISLGFIGVGTMGRGHLGGFLGRQDVEVVAVCDVEPARLELAAKMVQDKYADRVKKGEYSGVGSYKDYRKLLEHKGLDAVVIATPDHWHATASVAAARAGKHIYCEKPLTNVLAEGRWLVNEVAKAKVIFQTGSQQRSEFGGNFRKAVAAVWNGRIGKLHTIRIGVGEAAIPCDLPKQEIPAGTDWDAWVGPAPFRDYHEILCPKGIHKGFPAWRKYKEYGGGQIADMGAHHFDIAQWAMKMDAGGPVEIIPPADAKKNNGLKFLYSSGIVMIHNEFEGDRRADVVLEGDKGSILVSRGKLSASKPEILEPLPDDAEKVYPSNNHKENWINCIRTKQDCICTPEIGHRSASICHLGNIGYWTRRKLKWDAAKEQFEGDAEANAMLVREPRAAWKI
jgi:predicted dehydrogenase